MKSNAAVEALSALAHEARLALFRLLVPAGPGGVPAGEIARRLGIRESVLSFHLTRLRHAGLITARREGRRIFYAVDYGAARDLVGFLTENCCSTVEEGCTAACPPPAEDTIAPNAAQPPPAHRRVAS